MYRTKHQFLGLVFYGCAGSWLLRAGLLQLWRARAALQSPCVGSSLQWFLVFHRTCVSCIRRRILYHRAPREAQDQKIDHDLWEEKKHFCRKIHNDFFPPVLKFISFKQSFPLCLSYSVAWSLQTCLLKVVNSMIIDILYCT